MIVIQEILVSDEVLQRRFLCNLEACKGACCWEGDYGAPLEPDERVELAALYTKIKPYLSPAGIQAIEAQGVDSYYPDMGGYGTPLIDGRACAYLVLDHDGKAQCGIERAYNDGAIDYKKPLSCHLYPIRVKKNLQTGFEALNYDEWEICSAACTLGEKMQLPVYRFLREALVRKYGEAFYEELENAAAYLEN